METMSEWAGGRTVVGEARVHLELNLMGGVNGNEKDFYRHSGTERKTNLGQLLSGEKHLVTNFMEKAKEGHAILCLGLYW